MYIALGFMMSCAADLRVDTCALEGMDPAAYDRMAKAVNPYGDGQACPRIAQAILSHFLPDVQPPEPFAPAR